MPKLTHAPTRHLMAALAVATLSAPACNGTTRQPVQTVVWDQPGDRITATTMVQETLHDNIVHFEIARTSARLGTHVLFSGASESDSPPKVSQLANGVIGLQFMGFICAATASTRFTCSDAADMVGFFYLTPLCCDQTGAGVSMCSCAVEQPNRALVAAYQWATRGNHWYRARAAAAALTRLRHPDANAAVARLRRIWSRDIWLEALAARLDPTDNTATTAVKDIVSSGSFADTLVVARACVPSAKTAVARAVARYKGRTKLQAELRVAIKRCAARAAP